MKIISPMSDLPTYVYVIHWKRSVARNVISTAHTTFMYFHHPGLLAMREQKCKIVDATITDFEFVIPYDDSPACLLVWRPLLQAGIHDDLIDFAPEALKAFAELRRTAGHM
jgi:hypothetical protein